MNEFQVNKFITLKLEDGKTNIYVSGELFQQCKFLLLDISVEEISSFDEINSIDEASERLDKSLQPFYGRVDRIPSETEFWGHCSNLQVCYENSYDTRLLHSNLAFPLLKRLTDVGDPLAKRVFKEEIAKRCGSGYWPVIKFLMNEKYTEYLSREEFLSSILGYDEQGQKETTFILEMEELIGRKFDLLDDYDPEYNNFVVKNRHIEEMSIYTDFDINSLLLLIGSLYSLRILIILSKNLKSFPDSFGNLKKLELLHASNNKLHALPHTMKELKNLKNLNLRRNNITEFPSVICELTLLEELDLSGNHIKTIPKGIENLKHLKILWLDNNEIEVLPDSIGKLESLKDLYLNSNKLKEIPASLKNLHNFEFLNVFNNKIKNLEFLEILKEKGVKIHY